MTTMAIRQFRIENAVWDLLHDIAKDRNVKLYELYQSIIEWYCQQRAEGRYNSRALMPPTSSPLKTFWITHSTNKALIILARTEHQPVNRLLYSGIVRYLCNFGFI